MKPTIISILFVSAALSLSACSDRTEDKASETLRDAGATASSAADDAARNAERAGEAAADSSRDAGNALERAAEATGEAAKDAGTAVKGALQTVDVKSALTADSRVDASNINVDTDQATRTIVLKGRVPTAAQKTLAGEIATSHANNYNVRNELVVGR